MSLVKMELEWIDEGYDGVARSNYAMGLSLAFLGLFALMLDSAAITIVLGTLAFIVFAIFGWRMILSFRRDAERKDRF